MAIPLSRGSNPEDVVLPKDTWTKIFTGVNLAKITNGFNAVDTMWLSYKREGDDAPSSLDVPMWKAPVGAAKFEGSLARYDVYAYPVGKNLKVRLES